VSRVFQEKLQLQRLLLLLSDTKRLSVCLSVWRRWDYGGAGGARVTWSGVQRRPFAVSISHPTGRRRRSPFNSAPFPSLPPSSADAEDRSMTGRQACFTGTAAFADVKRKSTAADYSTACLTNAVTITSRLISQQAYSTAVTIACSAHAMLVTHEHTLFGSEY